MLSLLPPATVVVFPTCVRSPSNQQVLPHACENSPSQLATNKFSMGRSGRTTHRLRPRR
jgi:hypothetical protein